MNIQIMIILTYNFLWFNYIFVENINNSFTVNRICFCFCLLDETNFVITTVPNSTQQTLNQISTEMLQEITYLFHTLLLPIFTTVSACANFYFLLEKYWFNLQSLMIIPWTTSKSREENIFKSWLSEVSRLVNDERDIQRYSCLTTYGFYCRT